MKRLLLDLAPLRFNELMELARATIPTSAPAWTDHNVHDPGIMLAELLAFVADAQGYAVSRVRKDERAAYAQFFGIVARGAQPARGLIWPDWTGGDAAPWAPGTVIGTQAAIHGATERTATFHVRSPVLLSSAALLDVYSESAGSSRRSWRRINAQDGASFRPFGEPVDSDARLVLTFQGALATAAPADDAAISLGFELGAVVPNVVQTSNEALLSVHLQPPIVELVDDRGTRRLRVMRDTTVSLMRSGVLLLQPPDPLPAGDVWSLVLRCPVRGLVRSPLLRRIGLNVLPVEQLESREEVVIDFGRALPDQQYRLADGALLADSEHPVNVELGGQGWQPVVELMACSPGQTAFMLDRSNATVRFGNGVNGSMPPAAAALRVQYRATAGARGNLSRAARWQVQGVLGTFGSNSEPLAGGADAQSLADLRRIARGAVQTARPIVTPSDLTAAALALRELRVARAFEPADDSLRGRRLPGARMLVVVAADDEGRRTVETPAWLDTVQACLRGRLPLGQALQVRAPRYTTVGLKIRLIAQAQAHTEDVRAAAFARLEEALRVVPQQPGGSAWPFGRDVSALSVKAWLLRVPGVLRVEEMMLFADGVAINQAAIAMGPIGLPLLALTPNDIEVLRPTTRGSP